LPTHWHACSDQRDRYKRLGFDIPVATLVDQVRWSTDLLRPLWRAAVAECIASKVMHLDATGLPVLDHAASGGKRIGSLWGYVGDGVCACVYASTGKARAQKTGEMGPEDSFVRERRGMIGAPVQRDVVGSIAVSGVSDRYRSTRIATV
jgi:hypothetical protein